MWLGLAGALTTIPRAQEAQNSLQAHLASIPSNKTYFLQPAQPGTEGLGVSRAVNIRYTELTC